MQALAVLAVTLGFLLLVGGSPANNWSPAFPFAYAVFFLGRELYAVYARDEARRLRREREDNNLCLRCGYDLTGNLTGVCPECGDGAR